MNSGYKYFKLFKRDESGAIMPIAAIILFFVLVGILALSVDVGIDYKDQSNLEAKLGNCTNYAATEYTYWKIRNLTGASDRPNDNLVLVTTNISEEAALEALRIYVQDCVRKSDNELLKAEVKSLSIEYNKVNQAILVARAETPQSANFNNRARGAVIKSESGKMVPFYTGSVKPPSSNPVNVSGMVVFSLDYNGWAYNNADFEAFAVAARSAMAKVDLVGIGDIKTGLQIGNLPSDMPAQMSSRADFSIGWSGAMLDSSDMMASGNGHGNSALIRNWPFQAQIFARETRRCNGKPVWTYEKIDKGPCHQWPTTNSTYDSDNDDISQLEYDCGQDPKNCQIIRGSYSCCLEQVENCIPGSGCCARRGECLTLKHKQVGGRVYQGKWSVSCPKDKISAANTYQTPDKFMKFKAKLVASLNGSPVPQIKQIELVGSMAPSSKPLGPHENTELLVRDARNTDLSWSWACGWPFAPAPYSITGEYGNPMGDLAGRSMIAPVDSAAAILGCSLPPAPASSGLWDITFHRSGCTTPEEPLSSPQCNMPEGYYQIYVSVDGSSGMSLNKTMTAADIGHRPNPPGDTTTGPGGLWACGNCGKGNMNPNGLGDDGVGYTGYGQRSPVADSDQWGDLMCSNPNGNFWEPYTWFVDEDPKPPLDMILAEYLMVSDIAVETRRAGTAPSMDLLDNFNVKPPLGGDFIVDVSPALYPYFSMTGGGVVAETPAVFAADGMGIASFNGNTPVTDQLLGIVPLSNGLVKSIQASGAPQPANSAPISNLETVKKNGTNLTADNIPLGTGNLDKVFNSIGFGPYNIHAGHGGNWGPLLMAGAERLVATARADDSKILIYIGSCPDGAWNATDSTVFLGHKINWFAGSNATGGVPGVLDTATLALKSVNNPKADLAQGTEAVFNKVRGMVDYFMVVVPDWCNQYTKYSTDLGNPGEIVGNSSCVLGRDTPEDCAAEVIWALTGQRLEVRKYGMPSQ